MRPEGSPWIGVMLCSDGIYPERNLVNLLHQFDKKGLFEFIIEMGCRHHLVRSEETDEVKPRFAIGNVEFPGKHVGRDFERVKIV